MFPENKEERHHPENSAQAQDQSSTEPNSKEPRNVYTLNKDQLDYLSSIPLKCFCKAAAHKAYTAEYGPIYECASYNYSHRPMSQFQSKFICGFHIHERSWYKLLNNSKQDNVIDLELPELRVCPQFNFTVCTMFRVGNDYQLAPPVEVPYCFCNLPIVMHITLEGHVIQFTCPSASLEGAKKCSWSLPSKEVAYPKPNIRIHAYISEEQYLTQRQQKREELINHPYSNPNTHLLAHLFDYDHSYYDQAITNNLKDDKTIPTNVMAQNATKRVAAPTAISQEPDQHNSLLEECQKFTSTKSRMIHLVAEKDRADLESRILDSVSIVSQEKLSNTELRIAHIKIQNKKIAEENRVYRDNILELNNTPMEEIPKNCIACNIRQAEFCVQPCFHYGEVCIVLYVFWKNALIMLLL